jgi:hypothetical protein
MDDALAPSPLTIAGHELVSREHAGGLLNLRIALRGEPLIALARALAKLDGVRVTTGPETRGRERCYLVHCPGFKMVLSSPPADAPDHAVALVSRSPQAALAIMSDLGALLEHLMSEPPPLAAEKPAREPRSAARETSASNRPSTPLRRSGLQQGTPLARKTELKRKTPLARGRFNKV